MTPSVETGMILAKPDCGRIPQGGNVNIEHDNYSQTGSETKLPYLAPELVRYGDLHELTQATTVKAPTVDASSLP